MDPVAANPTLQKLFETREGSDVELRVPYGYGLCTYLEAHKAILAVSSKVFKSMLAVAEMNEEGDSIVIDIPDFEPQVINELLKYLYLAQVDMATYATRLFKVAIKYEIQDLLAKCEGYFIESLGKENMNWSSLLELVHLYGGRFEGLKLRDTVKYYFQRNVVDLMDDEGLLIAFRLFPDAFQDLFFSHYLS